MDYYNIIAAKLNLDINYVQMTNELLAAQYMGIPFSYPPERGSNIDVTAYSLFLRTNSTFTDYSYRGAKQAVIESWEWNEDLAIPYTLSVIKSLPFKTLGAIRVVYFPSVPCVEHTDWDDPADTKHTLGLSLIPSTADTHCNVWYEKENRYVQIPGNAMLLNDSIKHSVPAGIGTRITMRLFGEIDYSWFEDKIDLNYCYYKN